MKKGSFFAFGVVCLCQLALASSVQAELTPQDVGFLPGAHDLFPSLMADPRELQFAARAVLPVDHKLLGEAAMGDYLGLYRWALPFPGQYLQVSVGGGAFGLFDLASTTNDMQVVDFYANLPVDWRKGKWSVRFMPYHTSSHLGDDYLKATDQTTVKHSWDNLLGLVAYEPWNRLRLYGGYTYVMRTLPEGLQRNALQAGFEWHSAWWAHGRLRGYWANDFQSWQRTQWNPQYNSQWGIKLNRSAGDPRGISVFVEFGTGHQPQGQFYLNKETHWVLGLKFGLT